MSFSSETYVGAADASKKKEPANVKTITIKLPSLGAATVIKLQLSKTDKKLNVLFGLFKRLKLNCLTSNQFKLDGN